MTILVMDELRTDPFEQQFEIRSSRGKSRTHLEAIRLWLYKQANPAGTFTLKVKQGATVFGESSLTSAEINTGANPLGHNYLYGFIKFSFPHPLILEKGIYICELSSSGYTFNSGSFIGWIKEYESPTNTVTETIDNPFTAPYGLQLWRHEQ